jgi:hypothetical protein
VNRPERCFIGASGDYTGCLAEFLSEFLCSFLFGTSRRTRMQRIFSTLVFLLTAGGGFPLHAGHLDPKFPIVDQFRLLANDVSSPAYVELTEKMLINDPLGHSPACIGG